MRRVVPRLFALVLSVTTFTPAVAAQAPNVGTLIVAHGGDSVWNSQILEVANATRTGGPVRVAFLMGPAAAAFRFHEQIAALRGAGATRIAIVPFLMSSHSEHMDQLRWLLGMRDSLSEVMLHHLQHAGIERVADAKGTRLTPSIDDAPEAAAIFARRAKALLTSPGRQAILLFGHGPGEATDYARWMRNLRIIADSVKQATGVREVQVELVRDDAGAEVRGEAVRRARDLVRLMYGMTGEPVVVVPALVATGTLSRVTLARDLAGLPIAYDGTALLPSGDMARWVERRVREAFAATGTARAP